MSYGVRHLLSDSQIGIDNLGRPHKEKYRKIEKSFAELDRIESKSKGKHGRPFTFNLPDIGSETFKVFETPEKLEPYLWKRIEDISSKGKLYFCQTMSARQLETAHLAVGWLAPHLDPSQPGMHTGSLNDQKHLRVLWLMATPEDRDLHPPDPKMVDGRLIAVWRTSTEHQCGAEVRKKFQRLQNRVADRLGGNKAALEQNVFKRVVGGLEWRFHSFFRGGKEGIANPRQKGRIAAVVLLVSIPTSITVYAIVYGIQYDAVKHEMDKLHPQKANAAGSGAPPSPVPPPPPPYSLVAPAYPAPPAYAGPSGNGSVSLSA